MVTASCRIGYDFSTPDGPLTMKLAETPSRRAGLIISVFGVASSPMASLLARKTGGLEERQAYEGGQVRSRSDCRASSIETAGLELDCELRGPRESTASFCGGRRAYFCGDAWEGSCCAGACFCGAACWLGASFGSCAWKSGCPGVFAFSSSSETTPLLPRSTPGRSL